MESLIFWNYHGIIFLVCIALFPRLTMLLATSISILGGPLMFLGWLFVPHITVAILATHFYWSSNPILCIIAWFFALSGTSVESKCIKKGIGVVLR